MTFASADAFRDFERSVLHELRYVRGTAEEDFLATVLTTSHGRTVLLKAGYVLWRAQLGHQWYDEKQGEESFEVPGAYYPTRMKPIPEKAVDGRVNPKGIVCLYLATQEEAAV